MKTKLTLTLIAASLLLSTLNPQLSTCLAQGTSFTYQGRLNDGTNLANGHYDFQFQVFDALNLGSSYGSPNPNVVPNLSVSNGLFTVVLDFNTGVFTGADRWLQIFVRTNAAATYTPLSPRQKLTPTPYAIYAGNAAQIGGHAAGSFVAKAGDTMTGTLNLPPDCLAVGFNQLVTSGGNVGIGTTIPASKLVVVGDFDVDATPLNATFAKMVMHGGGPISFMGNANDRTLYLGRNGYRDVTVQAGTGNVGIGTPNPQAQFNVNGTTRIDAGTGAYGEGLVLNCPTDMTGGGYGHLLFQNGPRGGTLDGGTLRWAISYNYAPELGLTGGGLAFINDGNSTRLYLGTNGNGNVGIGSTSPQAKLEIQAGAETYGGGDQHALSFAYRYGGYRHWISSRHDGGGIADGNALDFYINKTNTAAGSSEPGVGNVKVMTLDSANGVKAVGGLVIETRTLTDPVNPAPGQIWLRTDLP